MDPLENNTGDTPAMVAVHEVSNNSGSKPVGRRQFGSKTVKPQKMTKGVKIKKGKTATGPKPQTTKTTLKKPTPCPTTTTEPQTRKNIPDSVQRHVQLCSIDSLNGLEPSNKDFEVIYGQEIRTTPESFQKRFLNSSNFCYVKNTKKSEKEIVDRVWAVSFNTVFNSREVQFIIISDILGLIDLSGTDASVEKREPLDLIFTNCSSTNMGIASTLLERFDQLNIATRINSIGFVNCSFGTVSVLKRLMAQGTLRALSIVDCSVDVDIEMAFPIGNNYGIQVQQATVDDPSDYWSDITCEDQILRLEIGVHCGDPFGIKLLQLIAIFSKATALSQRVTHSCVGGSNCMIKSTADLAMSNLMRTRSHKIEELEFDMVGLNVDLKAALFQTFSQIGCLKSLIFSGNSYDVHDVRHIKSFLQKMKSLKSVEIKSGVYFPEEGPNILHLFANCNVIINDLRISGVKAIFPNRHVKIGEGLLWNFPHLQTLVIENSEFTDIESCIRKYFGYEKKLRLKSLELNGTKEFCWELLEPLTEMAVNLTSLDLSGFSRWFPRIIGLGTEPMDLIFTRLNKLKLLVLDDLPIKDSNLIGKIHSHRVFSMIQKLDPTEPPPVSLILLQGLTELSLQNTEVSNLTVRCVARFMTKMTRLNVSFTHANLNGLDYAFSINKKLKICSLGCDL